MDNVNEYQSNIKDIQNEDIHREILFEEKTRGKAH